MAPFRDKFTARLTQEFVEPIERQLGVRLADWACLLQGQVTVALLGTDSIGTEKSSPGMLAMIDTRDKSDQLAKILADLRTRLADSEQKLRGHRLRDIEFTKLTIDLSKLGPSGKGPTRTAPVSEEEDGQMPSRKSSGLMGDRKLELMLGQSGSLLIAGTNIEDIEKVLVRLSGGTIPTLAELPAFEIARRGLSQNPSVLGWLDLAPIANSVAQPRTESAKGEQDIAAAAIQSDKLLASLGLTALKNLAFSMERDSDGAQVDIFIRAPEDQRKGIFRLLAIEAKDANPPSWVPADVAEFDRCRIDFQKLWNAFEVTVNDIAPGVVGFLMAELEAQMKATDPGFDFRTYFTENLGDDFVSYKQLPRDRKLGEFESPPALSLIASPKPDRLIKAITGAVLLLPAPLNAVEFKEREFLGKKIYSLVPPSLAAGGVQGAGQSANHFVATDGYLAWANDIAIIEEFLRRGESNPEPLADVPGWRDAAQRAGKGSGGVMGYRNLAESARLFLERAKSNPDQAADYLAFGPFRVVPADLEKAVLSCSDFSLLPPHEKIAKYFGMAVFAGHVALEGYCLRVVMPPPTPPESGE